MHPSTIGVRSLSLEKEYWLLMVHLAMSGIRAMVDVGDT